MAVIGYARVSTNGQSAEAQVAELTAAGATKVFQEKVSGATFDRATLKRAVTSVKVGDVLLVTQLDRLARSTRDLLNILDDSPSAVPISAHCAMSGRTPPHPTVA